MVIYVKNFLTKEPVVLHDKIQKNLDKGKRVVLDFGDNDIIEFDFLNESIGNIITGNNFPAIKHRINFINVDPAIKTVLQKVVRERNK
ncbi:MAG: STAS-like domain-containing protein [Fusobacteriota bacterium]